MYVDSVVYRYLNSNEQYAYNLVFDAITKGRDCDISRVKRGVDIGKILGIVLGDHPEIFYVDTKFLISGNLFKQNRVSFRSSINSRRQRQMSDDLDKKINEICNLISNKASDKWHILIEIYKYLQENISYDDAFYNKVFHNHKAGDNLSHTAYGALINKLAVCDGFSGAFSLLARNFGFNCMQVQGRSSFMNENNDNHAWNIIEYSGKYFHVDSTWDANLYAQNNLHAYNYFGLNDSQIISDHEWDISKCPTCDSDELSYFKHNNLYAVSRDKIVEFVTDTLKNKKKYMRFQVDDRVAMPVKDEELKDFICEVVKDASNYVSVNEFEYVFFPNVNTSTVTMIFDW